MQAPCKSPCKDCQDRYIGCHERCNKYQKYKAYCDKLRELRRKESIMNNSSPAKDKAYRIVYSLIRQGRYGK